MKNEIWKDINGFEGMYQISNKGRVKSLDRVIRMKNQWGWFDREYEGLVLKNVLHQNGYLRVGLKCKLYSVHRLVAEHFVFRDNPKKEVNHKDGNKLNNSADNLEWVTKSENIRHADRTGLRKMPKGKNHYSYGKPSSACKKVIDTKTGEIYSSGKKAALLIGMDYNNLNNRLRGKVKNNTNLKYLQDEK